MSTNNFLNRHEEIGHFGEGWTLAEVNKQYFYHNRVEDVRNVVHVCKRCQMVKWTNNIKLYIKEFKPIHVWDQFYRVALNTIRLLPETNSGNRYILVAIDHYFKWVEAKAIVEHEPWITVKFLEDKIICKFGIPKYNLADNGNEWVTKCSIIDHQ
jgi:hypothetical protein